MRLPHPLPEVGFVRLSSILAPKGPIPVSKSTWWLGIKTGRFPKPVKLSMRCTAWKAEDIHALIQQLGEQTVHHESTDDET